jgi:transposase
MTKNSELYPDFGKNTINEFETNYPQLSIEFKQIQQEQYKLFATKMLDYGIQNIALGSTLENEEDIKFSVMGIWLRCNDKINRLKNLIKRNGQNCVSGESMIDSFIDLSNYGIIAMMVLRNKWKN